MSGVLFQRRQTLPIRISHSAPVRTACACTCVSNYILKTHRPCAALMDFRAPERLSDQASTVARNSSLSRALSTCISGTRAGTAGPTHPFADPLKRNRRTGGHRYVLRMGIELAGSRRHNSRDCARAV